MKQGISRKKNAHNMNEARHFKKKNAHNMNKARHFKKEKWREFARKI